MKIKLLQNLNITGLGQQKAGAIVDVSDFVGRFYIGLGVAAEHTVLPAQTPKPPTTPTTPTNTTPTTQPKQTYPIVNKHPGNTVYIDTAKPEPAEEIKRPMPEPKAKALPEQTLPGEQLIRDSGPVKI